MKEKKSAKSPAKKSQYQSSSCRDHNNHPSNTRPEKKSTAKKSHSQLSSSRDFDNYPPNIMHTQTQKPMSMLQNKVSFSSESLELFDSQIITYRTYIHYLSSQYSELCDYLQTENEENYTLMKQYEYLEGQLENSVRIIHEKDENFFNAFMEKHNNLVEYIMDEEKTNEEQTEKFNKRCEQMENKEKNYQDGIKAKKNQIEELLKAVQTQSEEVEELNYLNKDFKSSKRIAGSSLYDIQSRLEQTENECGKIDGEQVDLLKDNKNFLDELMKVKKDISDIKIEFAKKENYFAELLEILKNDMKTKDAENTDLLNKKKALTELNNEKLNEKINEKNYLHEKLNKTNEIFTNKIELITNENVEINNKLTNAEKILKATEYELEKMTDHSHKLIADKKNSAQKIVECEQQINALNLKLNENNKNINDLNEKQLNHCNTVDQLKKQLNDKDEGCKKLQKQCEEKRLMKTTNRRESVTMQHKHIFSIDSSTEDSPPRSRFDYARLYQQMEKYQFPMLDNFTTSPIPKKKAKLIQNDDDDLSDSDIDDDIMEEIKKIVLIKPKK